MSAPARVSLLVPAKDEADNLPEFVRLCGESLPALGVPFEVVVVDDGSRDATPAVLRQLQAEHSWLRVVTHRRQRGIADALRSATDASVGEVLVFYPADLQYLPEDIPTLVAPILAGEADIVTGTKQGRYEKRLVSWVYNSLCRWLFGVDVTDLNSVKSYRREVMDGIALRPDWHRYMVVIAAAEGFRLTSRPVPLYPRRAGVSKFTWRRIPIGLLDLLSVWFRIRFGRKPMMFFGLLGAALVTVGGVVGVVAVVLRTVYRADVDLMVSLVMTMVITGVMLFGVGLLAEMVASSHEELLQMQRRASREK